MRGRNVRRCAADCDAQLQRCRREASAGLETPTFSEPTVGSGRSHGALRKCRDDMTKPVDQLFFACDTVA
jgi:hypothetical protein